MRAPISWLKEFVDIPFEDAELAEKLIAIGLKVEKIHRPGDQIKGVTVAEVMSVEPHPNADNLVLVELVQRNGATRVVCGAKNFEKGDKVALASPGAELPGMPRLEARKIRGEVSEGMLCSARELQIGDDRSGILVLPQNSVIGQDVRETLQLDETIFEFEVTANRPDAMSLIGVAYEVAAITSGAIRLPEFGSVSNGRTESTVEVELQDTERCPRYLALEISGVQVGPSPDWVQARLRAAGIRPVSNIVDATNYALVVTGQPLHAFDLAKVRGPKIVVRRASVGERITTIDGVDRALDPDDLVIADFDQAVAIAGVMGGLETEVSPETTNILLESAYFQPVSIFRSVKRHGLRSEASARFERGADIEMIPSAAGYAARLIAEWTVKEPRISNPVDEYPAPAPQRSVSMRVDRANAVLGTSLSVTEIQAALSRLGLEPAAKDGEVVVEVPSRRRDLSEEEDLIEELARVTGYDNIPYTLPPARARAGALTRDQILVRRIRQVLAGGGYHEAWTSILVGPSDIQRAFSNERWLTVAPEVANPMSNEESLLRPSLVPGLLRSLGYNVARRNTEIRLFEVGTCFETTEAYPHERLRVAIVAGGHWVQQWHGPKRAIDFYDLKGAIEGMLSALHLTARFDPKSVDPFHAGRSASIALNGKVIGYMGELDRATVERLDLPFAPVAAELDLTALLRIAGMPEPPEDPGRYPAVYLDIAVRVDEGVLAMDLISTAREAGGNLLEDVQLFDVYYGEQVGEGRKGIALALTVRSPERTLQEEEALGVLKQIEAALEKSHGAELRT
ncbi:MAG TPA: phenylalanine--tRNA ligase subunit beta [Actinomycetota bacterium]|nr:phenylalanine--tRNA ligase subunit beta [Actinomycetota bacterium]